MRLGMRVDAAANGVEGLRYLEATPPDLVVLDLLMPTLNGWGFLAASAGRRRGLPVVVMSGTLDLAANAARLHAMGVQVTLAKPFGMSALVALARGLTRSSATAA